MIVLTKADLILEKLPIGLREYIVSDPLAALYSVPGYEPNNLKLDMYAYMSQLHDISEDVADWLLETPSGYTFLSIAKNENVDLRFALISSLGKSPKLDDPTNSALPTRVLDPLFWALELDSQPT